MNALRRNGFVVGQQGKGVFVASEIPDDAAGRPDELSAFVQALSGRVSSLEGGGDQELREEVADLRAAVLELYARLGFPIPAKLARGDAARTSDPVAQTSEDLRAAVRIAGLS